MSSAIRVEQLSKRYRIPQSAGRAPYRTLREDLERLVAAPWQRWRNGADGKVHEDFWALQDVSFDVQHGEVLGIIGRNGAGKSTLLKILGRITRPTRGTARIRGRMGTLLEVGTGFHPELTGRENIFLSGSILGMHRREIKQKFDAIVDFAELEQFLETPVKRYSSGMYVRLAFAVAAHLEPEILLIDEVLAVGDVAFQRKCLSKMEHLAGERRTVLFVSHNMEAVRQLCPRSVLLDRGRVLYDGATQDALRMYHESLSSGEIDARPDVTGRQTRGSGAARFASLRVENDHGVPEWDFQVGDTVRVRFSFEITEAIPDLRFYFALQAGAHRETITTVSRLISETPLAAGTTWDWLLELPEINLRPGDYYVYAWLGSALGTGYDALDSISAPFPPLTIWSEETDPHKTAGFFSIPARLTCADQHASQQQAPFVK